MATKEERLAAIKEHFEAMRGQMNADKLASEIVMLKRAGAPWPDGTKQDWWEAIFEAVNQGHLELINGKDVKRAAPKQPEKKQDAQPTQGMLF